MLHRHHRPTWLGCASAHAVDVCEGMFGACAGSCVGSHSCVSVRLCGPGAVLLAAPSVRAVLVAAAF